eukprot:symbB.v1.2.000371.t1/scaffold17.1/size449391/8
MTFPWYRMTVPPDWRCPNCRRGLKDVDCWCGRESIEVTPRPSNLSQTQKIYTDKLKKEPFEEMRQRLLQRGQRQLKSQAEYLLQHMGLSEHQVQQWNPSGRPASRGSRPATRGLLGQSKSLSSLGPRDRPATSMSTMSRSSAGDVPGLKDPVMAYMMHGPPSYSPTFAGMASAALP